MVLCGTNSNVYNNTGLDSPHFAEIGEWSHVSVFQHNSSVITLFTISRPSYRPSDMKDGIQPTHQICATGKYLAVCFKLCYKMSTHSPTTGQMVHRHTKYNTVFYPRFSWKIVTYQAILREHFAHGAVSYFKRFGCLSIAIFLAIITTLIWLDAGFQ